MSEFFPKIARLAFFRGDANSESDDDQGVPKARFSRRLRKKVNSLADGDVARFQVDGACCMILRIGTELFIRPFGQNSEIYVNGVAAPGLTKIELSDVIKIGRQHITLERPKRKASNDADEVDELLKIKEDEVKQKDRFKSAGGSSRIAPSRPTPSKVTLKKEPMATKPPRRVQPLPSPVARSPKSSKKKKVSLEKTARSPRKPDPKRDR
ncbi:MAG: hypothetical protein ACOX0A_08310 [Thermoguttaceae bacterium]|jgi:hypothetical protein